MDDEQRQKVEQSMQAAQKALKELEDTMARAKVSSEQGNLYMDKLKEKMHVADAKVEKSAWSEVDQKRADNLLDNFLTNIGGECLSKEDVEASMKQVSNIVGGRASKKGEAKKHQKLESKRIRL